MKYNLETLLSAKKFVPHFERRKGADPLSLGPVSVEFHWTSACNYDCVHCSYGNRRKKYLRVSDEQIESTIDDLLSLGVKSAYLAGGGEPTMVKNWDKYAGKLLDNGVEVALVTNGIAIKDADVPLLRRFNYIAVSIYSTNEEHYKAITGSDQFKKQFQLPNMVKGNGSNVVVGARCVINRVNHREVADVYKNAMASGFDYVIFIPAIDYEKKGPEFSEAEAAQIRADLEGNIDIFDPKTTNVRSILNRGLHHYAAKDYRIGIEPPPDSCASIMTRATAWINYDGGVYLCQPHIGNERYCIGNLNNARFKDVWNSPRHREVILALNGNYAAGVCANCRCIEYNRQAGMYLSGQVQLGDCPDDALI